MYNRCSRLGREDSPTYYHKHNTLANTKMQDHQEQGIQTPAISRLLKKTKNELTYRNYSQRTVESYLFCVERYFKFKKTDLGRVNVANIKYFLFRLQRKGLAPETINLHLNAIKFFYREVLEAKTTIGIKFARKNKRLPVVLSKDEVSRLLASATNSKHKLLLSLAYGAGLRLSEVISLKVKDISIEELVCTIRNTKSRHDRTTVFPEKIKHSIQNLIAGKERDDYVFESERGGKLSARSAQKAFEKALKQSGIKKAASFHSLRHSFATHLLESGVNIRYIQELLGHKNIRTTQIYTKVTSPAIRNIKSPL